MAGVVAFFVMGWRGDALKTGDAKDEFLTTQPVRLHLPQRRGVHPLLPLAGLAARLDAMKKFMFAPRRVRRAAERSASSGLLRALYNDRNFSVEGAVHRINHAQMHAIIAARRRDDFSYPAHRKHLPQESFQRPGRGAAGVHRRGAPRMGGGGSAGGYRRPGTSRHRVR